MNTPFNENLLGLDNISVPSTAAGRSKTPVKPGAGQGQGAAKAHKKTVGSQFRKRGLENLFIIYNQYFTLYGSVCY